MSHADTIMEAINLHAWHCRDDEECLTRDKGEHALDALLAENQRLREALKWIAARGYSVDELKDVQKIAREALAGDAE